MDIEKLSKLNTKQKKEVLKNLIKNDVSYWKKISVLLAMLNDNDNTELLDLIIENKIKEIDLANKIYHLNLYPDEINRAQTKSYVSIMGKIINGSNDPEYSKACSETLEILKFIPPEYYDKINTKFIERLQNSASKDYQISIEKNAKFEDVKMLDETKDILS